MCPSIGAFLYLLGKSCFLRLLSTELVPDLALYFCEESLPLPLFRESTHSPVELLRKQLSDRVRLERRQLGLSQKDFADKCGIPLRTYKRFEKGDCDSLDAFLRIVKAFERVITLDLLFPGKPVVLTEVRSPTAALARLMNRVAEQAEKK